MQHAQVITERRTSVIYILLVGIRVQVYDAVQHVAMRAAFMHLPYVLHVPYKPHEQLRGESMRISFAQKCCKLDQNAND